MEFKGRSTDPFEQLITETLDEQFGAAPSASVWNRIAEEISQPMSRGTREPPQSQPSVPSAFSFLPSYGVPSGYRVGSTLILVLLLMLVGPRVLQQWNQTSSLPPGVVPTALPYFLPQRPVPESDLRATEKQVIPKGHAVPKRAAVPTEQALIEQEQPAQLGAYGLGARGEVIFSPVIQANPVIRAPNQNHLLGSELDKVYLESKVEKKETKQPQPVRRRKPQPDNRHTAA